MNHPEILAAIRKTARRRCDFGGVPHVCAIQFYERAGEESAVIDMGIASEDSSVGQTGVGVVTPERIPMLFFEDGKSFCVAFEKNIGRSRETGKSERLIAAFCNETRSERNL